MGNILKVGPRSGARQAQRMRIARQQQIQRAMAELDLRILPSPMTSISNGRFFVLSRGGIHHSLLTSYYCLLLIRSDPMFLLPPAPPQIHPRARLPPPSSCTGAATAAAGAPPASSPPAAAASPGVVAVFFSFCFLFYAKF